MNTELKSLIATLFDGEKLVVDSLKKNYFSVITDGMSLLGDTPGDIAGYSDLANESKELSNAANMTDLVSFVQQKFASVEQLSNAKAQDIITGIVAVITACIALEQKFVS